LGGGDTVTDKSTHVRVPNEVHKQIQEERDHILKETRYETMMRILKKNILEEESRLRRNREEIEK
jgi:hypothetical protein